jgi:3-hydroxybutyryl-CoA dehydratase
MITGLEQGKEFVHDFEVSSEIYSGFISTFKDRNPMHTDEEYAKLKGFTGKLMHGNILNGFLSYFIGELLPVKNVIIISQSIRYNSPVYLNEKLVFKAKIESITESVNVVELKFSFLSSFTQKLKAKGIIQIQLL